MYRVYESPHEGGRTCAGAFARVAKILPHIAYWFLLRSRASLLFHFNYKYKHVNEKLSAIFDLE